MNLILECDTPKIISHDLIQQAATNQFYLRAKKDVLFVGLKAMIEKYFSKPITSEDILEAKQIMTARGQLDKAKLDRWEYILNEHNGFLPISIRSIPEGTFVKAGSPILTVETNDPECLWASYAVDSIILRSIWYPSSVATRLHAIREALNWNTEPVFMHDLTNRACCSGESSQISASVAKMIFPLYDSVQADIYLSKYYDKPISAVNPAYVAEHNHIIGWDSEEEMINRLKAVSENSEVVFQIDTYDVGSCLSLIMSDEIKSLCEERKLSIYVSPDSVQALTEIASIYDKVVGRGIGVVKTCLNLDSAKKISALNVDPNMMAFSIEDSVLQEGLSRATYGFEFKQCAVKRGAGERWAPVSKHPKNNPEMATLSGLQFPYGSETVYISGYIMEMDGYVPITNRLA